MLSSCVRLSGLSAFRFKIAAELKIGRRGERLEIDCMIGRPWTYYTVFVIV